MWCLVGAGVGLFRIVFPNPDFSLGEWGDRLMVQGQNWVQLPEVVSVEGMVIEN